MSDLYYGITCIVILLFALCLFVYYCRKDEVINDKQSKLIDSFNDEEKIKFTQYQNIAKQVKFKEVLTYGRKQKKVKHKANK